MSLRFRGASWQLFFFRRVVHQACSLELHRILLDACCEPMEMDEFRSGVWVEVWVANVNIK
jgi:hypothetical protein